MLLKLSANTWKFGKRVIRAQIWKLIEEEEGIEGFSYSYDLLTIYDITKECACAHKSFDDPAKDIYKSFLILDDSMEADCSF